MKPVNAEHCSYISISLEWKLIWQCVLCSINGERLDLELFGDQRRTRLVSEITKSLQILSSVQGSRGELLLSLCYNPSANSIVVNIIKARNLKAMDIGGTSGTGFQDNHYVLSGKCSQVSSESEMALFLKCGYLFVWVLLNLDTGEKIWTKIITIVTWQEVINKCFGTDFASPRGSHCR